MNVTKPHRPRRWLALVCVACVLLLSVLFLHDGIQSLMRISYPRQYSQLVNYYAQKYQLDENYVYAVIRTESGFDADAQSSVGALGLMQITEETFSWIKSRIAPDEMLEFQSLRNPETNIRFGVYFLAYCMERYENDFATAAAAYHSGVGLVDGLLKDRAYSANGMTLHTFPYNQMRHYVRKVTQSYAKYTALYAQVVS